MPYNLLAEPWLPVRRADGSLDLVAPHQVAPSPGQSPPVAFASARPDGDGALAQFMVGLLQTAAAPANDDAWAERWEAPPTPDDLRDAFAPLAVAFDLDGDGPRFLQDYDANLEGTAKPAAYLLLETPTDNTLKNNADHFVKDRTDHALSLPVVAQALLSLQLHAPSGGKGHRTSLRGGGPMTTLVTAVPTLPGNDDAPLWRTLWLNVLSADAFGPPPDDLSSVFPWLAPTRVSAKGTATEVTVAGADAHPLQAFWGTPRRVRLRFSGPATCDATGQPADRTVDGFVTATYGVNYDGPWDHPLSPHRVEEAGERAYLTEAHRLGYADWLAFALGAGDPTTSTGRVLRPARAVRASTARAADLRGHGVPGLDALGLWAFGFDTDNMKVRAWTSSHFPLLPEPPGTLAALHDHARQLVQATDAVAGTLKSAIKKALFGSARATAKGGVAWDYPFHIDNQKTNDLYGRSLFVQPETELWAGTEADFFNTLDAVRQALGDPGQIKTLKDDWLQTLSAAALALFDQTAAPDRQHRADPQALSLARASVRRVPRNRRLRESLGLANTPAHA